MLNRPIVCFLAAVFLATETLSASMLQLPTANDAIFRRGAEERYFVSTTGKPWMSGTFGCVRSGHSQMHEGIDIRCLERDKRGEPIDPVKATADGMVAYINLKPSLSNYGNYVVLRHYLDGLELYSVYAHLSKVRDGLKIGQNVKAGERIATMGRTTNTREGISKERAHVHFELNFFVNEHFSSWFRKHFPGQRNDHGIWNGQNMIGIDPQAVLFASHREGSDFNLRNWVQKQNELCRVFVRAKNFPWLKRYPALIKSSPAGDVVGYDLVLNFNGLPFEIYPRTSAPSKNTGKYQLLAVDANEAQENPCRHLVSQRGGRWELAPAGLRLLELLTN